jgi:hypothetical protein
MEPVVGVQLVEIDRRGLRLADGVLFPYPIGGAVVAVFETIDDRAGVVLQPAVVDDAVEPVEAGIRAAGRICGSG